jgi:hypothetical protein
MGARRMFLVLGPSLLALACLGCSAGRRPCGQASGGVRARPNTAVSTPPVTPPSTFAAAGWKTDQPAVDPRALTAVPPTPSVSIEGLPPGPPPAIPPTGELPGAVPGAPPGVELPPTGALPPLAPLEGPRVSPGSVTLEPAQPPRPPIEVEKKVESSSGLGRPPAG